jgi:long-chain acyl-CoA synthetase
MIFLETIFDKLHQPPAKPILQEIVDGQFITITTFELLQKINHARQVLKQAGLQPGDRCAMLGPNSHQWVALNLAIMAEGALAVPLYHRQAPAELAAIMKDCTPRLLCCATEALKEAIFTTWPDAPQTLLYADIWGGSFSLTPPPAKLEDSSPVTILYTSGTSGEAKGVVLNVGNVSFMLVRTIARLGELMDGVKKEGDDRIFHWAPFCFASSWIMLLSCLARNNCLMLSMDLNKLTDELKVARPHYFSNVPALLERVRAAIQTQLQLKGGAGLFLFKKGEAAWTRKQANQCQPEDGFWLKLAQWLVFAKIKQRIGLNLRGLICGSAPLAEETQLFFHMIGIPVLQVYGLTETTAICTMDDVHRIKAGFAGPAIPGIEMKLGENDEIIVRGPNIFPGYWNRPQATAEVLKEGWFHTGDQGYRDENNNWKIIGRLKNLIIPSSGHNISPEPIEQRLQAALPEAEHIMVVGNGRKFLSMIITGKLTAEKIEHAAFTKALNPSAPIMACSRPRGQLNAP